MEENRIQLRRRNEDTAKKTLKNERDLHREISLIFKKSAEVRTERERNLLKTHPRVLKKIEKRALVRSVRLSRLKEVEDSAEVLSKKCRRLAEAIEKSRFLVTYTGAGISTAADIPDYRGPNGVWTRLEKGLEIGEYDLVKSEPTLTHMALFALFKKGKLKHVVSQNCDGLHTRSGVPRYYLSELHGNMFIEICKRCKPMRPFIRLFDVTERTSKNRHTTCRRCYVCGSSLYDTIVHFGERGSLKWPINWDGASKAAGKADVILCLGSSLKVLRRYPWLWNMDKPKDQRPKLFIVNLQWTPKDKHATLKLNAKCDDVMKKVFEHFDYDIPSYYSLNDPLLSFATRLNPIEEHTTSRKSLGDFRPINEKACIKHLRSVVATDHNYFSASEIGNNSEQSNNETALKVKNGQFVKSESIDFKSIVWPNDALYIQYENKFEFLENADDKDGIKYVCDCCDPAKRRRRSNVSSDEEDEEDGEDETEDAKEKISVKKEDEEDDKSNVEKKGTFAPSSSKITTGPGWFGKGRRKKLK